MHYFSIRSDFGKAVEGLEIWHLVRKMFSLLDKKDRKALLLWAFHLKSISGMNRDYHCLIFYENKIH